MLPYIFIAMYPKIKSHRVKTNKSSLLLLPDELITCIFQLLPLPDLFNLNVISNARINRLVKSAILNKLYLSGTHHLRIHFHHHVDEDVYVDFVLTHMTDIRLVFTPVNKRIVNVVLKKALLQTAYLIGPDFDKNGCYLNLITSSFVTDIRQEGSHNVECKDHVSFNYSVFNTPDNIINTRSSVKWIEPTRIACPIEFLCQPRKSTQLIMCDTPSKPLHPKRFNRSITSNHRSHQHSSLHSIIRRSIMPIIGGLTTTSTSTMTANNPSSAVTPHL
ncbi:hypothetical protein BDB01DRAFT_45552 [Pilobolus umbonatus]|nr:hypothetical protein BDB01DRAFT_45552 [Pilobolus umbonatus]